MLANGLGSAVIGAATPVAATTAMAAPTRTLVIKYALPNKWYPLLLPTLGRAASFTRSMKVCWPESRLVVCLSFG